MAVGKSADGPAATTPAAKGQRSQAELERIAAGVVVSGVTLVAFPPGKHSKPVYYCVHLVVQIWKGLAAWLTTQVQLAKCLMSLTTVWKLAGKAPLRHHHSLQAAQVVAMHCCQTQKGGLPLFGGTNPKRDAVRHVTSCMTVLAAARGAHSSKGC